MRYKDFWNRVKETPKFDGIYILCRELKLMNGYLILPKGTELIHQYEDSFYVPEKQMNIVCTPGYLTFLGYREVN